MAAGELLTGGRVSWHDGFAHVGRHLVRPSFLVRLVARVYVSLA